MIRESSRHLAIHPLKLELRRTERHTAKKVLKETVKMSPEEVQAIQLLAKREAMRRELLRNSVFGRR